MCKSKIWKLPQRGSRTVMIKDDVGGDDFEMRVRELAFKEETNTTDHTYMYMSQEILNRS